MKKSVLVTGGAGFLGSGLVRHLVAAGHKVGVLDDFSRGRQDRVPAGVTLHDGDIRSWALTSSSIRMYDVIVHMAYVQGTQNFTEHPHLTINVALKGIINVLDACQIHGGRELILVSSSEAYQTPPAEFFPTAEDVPLSVPDVTNPRYAYGGGKIACEIAALAYSDVNSRTVIVRPHNIYGPDMGHEHVIPQFAERALALALRESTAGYEGVGAGDADFHIQGSGEETRSFCFIEDAAAGLRAVIDRGGDREVYHLGTEEETRVYDLAAAVCSHYGLAARVVPGELWKGSPTRRLPATGKLEALGYQPRWMLADGLRPTLDWYREHSKVAPC